MVNSLAAISANAVTPDQLLPYVKAVSGLESAQIGECVLHYGDGQGVLVAYPRNNPHDVNGMNKAVEDALSFPGLKHLTVLGPDRPEQAPVDAAGQCDSYWQIVLPVPKPGVKLRNMLKRAGRDIIIEQNAGPGCWQKEHADLANDFCQRKKDSLDAGTCYLFAKLQAYLEAAPDAVLFSARDSSNKLAAFAIGDYTALANAFYMFAARAVDSPPGTADLLLQAVIAEAEARGHASINLGLGIDEGIGFFKKKWGGVPFLKYVETSWPLTSKANWKSFFARLFGIQK